MKKSILSLLVCLALLVTTIGTVMMVPVSAATEVNLLDGNHAISQEGDGSATAALNGGVLTINNTTKGEVGINLGSGVNLNTTPKMVISVDAKVPFDISFNDSGNSKWFHLASDYCNLFENGSTTDQIAAGSYTDITVDLTGAYTWSSETNSHSNPLPANAVISGLYIIPKAAGTITVKKFVFIGEGTATPTTSTTQSTTPTQPTSSGGTLPTYSCAGHNLMQNIGTNNETFSAVTTENGAVVGRVSGAWDSNTNNAYGIAMEPGLTGINTTTYRYIHLAVNSNVPFRVTTLDRSAAGDKWIHLGAEFFNRIESMGGVAAEGNFIPAGSYVLSLDYGSIYEWKTSQNEAGWDATNANLTGVYFETKVAGTIAVSHVYLSSDDQCKATAPSLPSGVTTTQTKATSTTRKPVMGSAVTYTVGSAIGTVGGTVQIPVSVTDNHYMVNGQILIKYDPTVLEIQKPFNDEDHLDCPYFDTIDTNVLKNTTWALGEPVTGTLKFGFASSNTKGSATGGTIFTLTFKLLNDAAHGSQITLEIPEMVSNDLSTNDQYDFGTNVVTVAGVVAVEGAGAIPTTVSTTSTTAATQPTTQGTVPAYGCAGHDLIKNVGSNDDSQAVVTIENGAVVGRVTGAWGGEANNVAYGIAMEPMLENIDMTTYRYFHVAVNSNVPFRITTLDRSAAGDKWIGMGAEFFDRIEGMGSAQVGDFIPAGSYVLCLDYGSIYEWKTNNNVAGWNASNANMTGVYFETKSAGTIAVSHAYLSTDSSCKATAPSLPSGVTTTQSQATSTTKKDVMGAVVTYTVGSATGTVGSTVEIPVSVSANHYMVNGQILIKYDPAVLELQKLFNDEDHIDCPYFDAIDATVIKNASWAFAEPTPGTLNFSFATSNTKGSATGGTIFTLTFKILSDAANGSQITLEIPEMVSNDFTTNGQHDFGTNTATVAGVISVGTPAQSTTTTTTTATTTTSTTVSTTVSTTASTTVSTTASTTVSTTASTTASTQVTTSTTVTDATTSTTATETSATQPVPTVKGDLNGDGNCNITDAVMLFYHVAEKTPLSEDVAATADYTNDGEVDIKDALMIYQYVRGVRESL